MINNNAVSIDELRSNLADIVNRVTYAKDRIVVRRYNRDAAIIISLDEYEKLMDPTKRLSKAEWDNSVRKLGSIRNSLPSNDPELLDREIDKAVEEVRDDKRSQNE